MVATATEGVKGQKPCGRPGLVARGLVWVIAKPFSTSPTLPSMVLEGNPEVGSPRTSDLLHSGGQGPCALSSPCEGAQPGEEPIKYGELIVLG